MISRGTILSVTGGTLSAHLPGAAIGSGVTVRTANARISGVVTALQHERAIVALHGPVDGVANGDEISSDPAALTMPLGTVLLGRTVDSAGAALDDLPAPSGRRRAVHIGAPAPSQRMPIVAPFWTGVRAIDSLVTIGRGARIGVFGAPGCGKSTLLHQLMNGSYADAAVIALLGERGREAEEWMRRCPQHASIVCATSDRSAAERVRAAHVAMVQANALRSRGLHVLVILDSLARFAGALREIALANGEIAGRGGYPPSVFAELARVVEVAGATPHGSVTLIASVLSDGDERDPVSDAARSLLDGHIALCTKLAHAGRFPAIDPLASASRTMNQVASPEHLDDARLVRRAAAALAETQDARRLGIALADAFAIRTAAAEPQIEAFLRQGNLPISPAESLSALAELADTLR